MGGSAHFSERAAEPGSGPGHLVASVLVLRRVTDARGPARDVFAPRLTIPGPARYARASPREATLSVSPVPPGPHGLCSLLERVAGDAPCFVGVSDAQFRPLFVNGFGRRMVGLADDFDVTKLSVADFLAADERESITRCALPALASEGLWQGDHRFHRFVGGEGVLMKWTAFLLRGEDGEVLGAGFYATDLSERLETEARLRESRAHLKAAGDLVGLGSYTWDPQTGALRWDERLRRIWGVPADAAIDEALWLEGVDPADRERVRAVVAAATNPEGAGVYAIEYRVRGLSGGPEKWVATFGQTEFEGGKPVKFTGAVLDITNQKLVEAQLRRSEAYLAAILRQLPVGVAVFDAEGRLVLSNPAAERFKLNTMPSRDSAGLERWEGVRPDGSALRAAEYPGSRALRGEITAPGAIFRYLDDNGARIWARVSAAPLREAGGPVEGVVSIIEDVNEQRENEERLRESEERFRRFAENSSDLIWILDAKAQRMEYLSPGFQHAWGGVPGRGLGRSRRLEGVRSQGRQGHARPDDRGCDRPGGGDDPPIPGRAAGRLRPMDP